MRVAAAGLLVLTLLVAGCAQGPAPSSSNVVPPSNELVRWFTDKHPEARIVASALADVTDDGVDDLVVIYRGEDVRRRWMRVVVGGGDPIETNEVRAPMENQRITFRDIDEKGPVEFIVRGSKAGAVGFAIFRVTGTRLEDLFGENMDRCC